MKSNQATVMNEPQHYSIQARRYQIVVFEPGKNEGVTLHGGFSVLPIKQAADLCGQFASVYIYDSLAKEGRDNYWKINADGSLEQGVEI